MNYLETAHAQPAPWPSVATFWAPVMRVGGSAQPEFTGCYAGVLIVYMPGRGALSQDAIVLTKDHNLCTLLQTAFITKHQGLFKAKLMSDPLPLPVQGLAAGGKPVYDITSVILSRNS